MFFDENITREKNAKHETNRGEAKNSPFGEWTNRAYGGKYRNRVSG